MTAEHEPQPRPGPASLGALEQQVIETLWDHGPLSVREVIAALGSDHAYTTIATVLSNLERKDMVISRREGRYVRHLPRRSRSEHAAQLMQHALSTSRDRTASILHFVEAMDEHDLSQLRRYLEAQRPAPAGDREQGAEE